MGATNKVPGVNSEYITDIAHAEYATNKVRAFNHMFPSLIGHRSNLNQRNKRLLHMTNIAATMLYGAEAWNRKNSEKSKLSKTKLRQL